MKKKLLAVLTVLVLVLAFTACGASESEEISYLGEWEHIGTIQNSDNVDDALTAEIISPVSEELREDVGNIADAYKRK